MGPVLEGGKTETQREKEPSSSFGDSGAGLIWRGRILTAVLCDPVGQYLGHVLEWYWTCICIDSGQFALAIYDQSTCRWCHGWGQTDGRTDRPGQAGLQKQQEQATSRWAKIAFQGAKSMCGQMGKTQNVPCKAGRHVHEWLVWLFVHVCK